MSKRVSVAKWSDKYNRWQINVQKDGIRRSFYSSTPGRNGQRECHKKADSWLDDNIKDNIKVEQLYELFLKETKDTSGTGNYENYKSFWENWIKKEIGNKKVDTLTEQHLQNIINAAYKKGRSKKTLKNLRGLLTRFMKFARKCNTTTLYPENLKIPEKAYQKEKRILQPEMLKKLFSNDVTKDWYLNAFRFYTATGLRRGELIAIQTKRDLENGILYIRESVNKYQELTDGKNTNAKRVLKLNNIELNIIKDQLYLLKTNGIKSKYLFPNEKGERINPSTIYKKWVLFCEKNELEKISLHELRHTFISLCKEIPLELLKSRVGHSAQMDTFGQYGHAIEGEMEETSKLVEESFLKVIQ